MLFFVSSSFSYLSILPPPSLFPSPQSSSDSDFHCDTLEADSDVEVSGGSLNTNAISGNSNLNSALSSISLSSSLSLSLPPPRFPSSLFPSPLFHLLPLTLISSAFLASPHSALSLPLLHIHYLVGGDFNSASVTSNSATFTRGNAKFVSGPPPSPNPSTNPTHPFCPYYPHDER